MESTEAGELINALRGMGKHDLAEWVSITQISQVDYRDQEWNEWIDGRADRAWPDGPKLGDF